MNDQTDQQLLRAYAQNKSEAAFAAIVHRYIDLVYSAAFRMVCDAQAAKDVTQGVFVALAQNARQLTDRPALAGWLHCTARNLATKAVRSEVRRRAREQEAAVMNELLSANPDANWEHIAIHLDEALGDLDDTDRDAVLLRYFKNHDLRTVGATLGISDDAAQKRVSRAVERLREFFAKRGVTVGMSGLTVVISANAVQAAPVGLAITISTAAALTGPTLATSATITTTKAIAMTALQKTIVTATIAVLAGAGIYEARQASQLHEQVQTFQQQQIPLAEQNKQLQSERDAANQKLTAHRDENEQLRRNTAELLRLRGELARLKATSVGRTEADPTESAAKSWLTRVNQLKQRIEAAQGKIPELQFLNERDWLEIANTKLETDADFRTALGELRKRGEGYLVKKLQAGLNNYMRANNGQWPAEISQLAPYFTTPVDDAMLQRWKIVPKSAFPSQTFATDWVITEKAPVDEEFDHRWTIDGPSSAGVGRYQHQPAAEEKIKVSENETVEINKITLEPVLKAYSAAHDGKEPTDIYQLQPYLATSEQRAAWEKTIEIIAAKRLREE